MSALGLVGICKRFAGDPRAAPALAPLDLELARGELVVLVGPSGAGKSTALRIVAGLEEPSAGRVLIDGHDVTAAPPAQRDVALVGQGTALHAQHSVFENLAFSLRLRGVDDDELARRVLAAAHAVGVVELLTRRPRQLSAGQRQRVAVARAVVRAPRVLLFDEPLGNLDRPARVELRRVLRRLHDASGATTLYVTHDATEAMTLADRIVTLGPPRPDPRTIPSPVHPRRPLPRSS